MREPVKVGERVPRMFSDIFKCYLILDVNECVEFPEVCGGGGCNDLQGGYECVCGEGLRVSPDQSTCVDIDECALNRSKSLPLNIFTHSCKHCCKISRLWWTLARFYRGVDKSWYDSSKDKKTFFQGHLCERDLCEHSWFVPLRMSRRVHGQGR